MTKEFRKILKLIAIIITTSTLVLSILAWLVANNHNNTVYSIKLFMAGSPEERCKLYPDYGWHAETFQISEGIGIEFDFRDARQLVLPTPQIEDFIVDEFYRFKAYARPDENRYKAVPASSPEFDDFTMVKIIVSLEAREDDNLYGRITLIRPERELELASKAIGHRLMSEDEFRKSLSAFLMVPFCKIAKSIK
ncbi:MAG: hypothetical protein ACQEQL_01725 [Pseudomonadota bacterium]